LFNGFDDAVPKPKVLLVPEISFGFRPHCRREI